MSDHESTIPPADVPPLIRGDECKALTGGPIMTVTQEDGDHVICKWPYGTARVARVDVRRVDKASDWRAK